MITSFLLATLIYGSYPSLDVFVQGKPVWGTHIDCKEANFFYETCCWWEDFGTYIAYACQTCYDSDGYGSTGYEDCKPLVKQRTISGSDVRAPAPAVSRPSFGGSCGRCDSGCTVIPISGMISFPPSFVSSWPSSGARSGEISTYPAVGGKEYLSGSRL